MSFEWDERRQRSNLEKQGLDFLDVSAVFEDPHIVVPLVYSGGEERFLAIGELEGRRLHFSKRSYHGYFLSEGTS